MWMSDKPLVQVFRLSSFTTANRHLNESYIVSFLLIRIAQSYGVAVLPSLQRFVPF